MLMPLRAILVEDKNATTARLAREKRKTVASKKYDRPKRPFILFLTLNYVDRDRRRT